MPSPGTDTRGGRRSLLPIVGLGLLLVLFAGRLTDSATRNSLTVDEPHYMGTGVYLWRSGDYHFADTLLHHPPLTHHLASLPLLAFDLSGLPPTRSVAETLVERGTLSPATLRIVSRLPFVLLSCWGALLGFLWAREVAGSWAGLLAAFLFTFSPTLLAHGSIAHSDIVVSVLYFQTLYLFWRWSMKPAALRLVLCGISIGLVMLAKHTAVLLWATLALLLVLSILRLRPASPTHPWIGPEGFLRRALWAAGVGATLLGLAAGIVWLGYGGSFAWVEDPAGRFPNVALPAWVQALFWFLDGHAAGRTVFFLGNFATETQGWIFFPLAYAIKTPVGTLLLLILALATLRSSPHRLGRFLGVPCLVYLVVVLFWLKTPIGLRYMLPLYPLLLLFIATQLAPLASRGWRRPVVLGACAWTAAASLWIHPHYLAYFNELIGGPAHGHRYLLDSNIDWGQDLGTLARYLRARGNPPVRLAYFGAESPSTYGIRGRQLHGCQPVRGLVAISANVLGGLHASPDPLAPPVPGCYEWLKRYEPVARPGYSIFVYEIPRRPKH